MARKPPPEEPPAVAERLTIALTSDASEAIGRVQARTRMKKVDIFNRAAVVYDFLDTEMRQGKQIILRSTDGTEERVRIV